MVLGDLVVATTRSSGELVPFKKPNVPQAEASPTVSGDNPKGRVLAQLAVEGGAFSGSDTGQGAGAAE